ncbi:class I SAM-dependent methyltransferase [Laceyella sacchari]|jgi:ubiquinone/menaquinone biosynthesis C-methylase UbiE|uniref:Methyltransferase domain-containing protein n=1 Tax=Laceyella sacchari TaxID=37482 RepID=A0ABY5U5W4_LACSH|nr:class I SAM-dependent methyltransferase [Laceyella sacchari]UWE04390.1 methyltransferase domain-containing protein [Laceyella sacchari]
MPIDFHSKNNRFTYAARQAYLSWISTIQNIVDVKGKRVLDMGCGGGIYCKAFAQMGAKHVTGIDFSKEMIKGATENCKDYPQIAFVVGDALDTNLPSSTYDVILARALIHHLSDLESCFRETYRLLKPGGIFIVQNRTIENALQPPSENHIRGYFFEVYPRLIDIEAERRHDGKAVKEALLKVGFRSVDEHPLCETRKTYTDLEELKNDLLARTGRSILHELSDPELEYLVQYISERLSNRSTQEIVEQDYWTIWVAKKE